VFDGSDKSPTGIPSNSMFGMNVLRAEEKKKEEESIR